MAERKIVQMQELNKNTKEVVANQMPQTLAEAVLYTNAEPMVSAHGGIPAGTTFEDTPIAEILTDILYPYTKPTVSLQASVAAGVKEKGASLANIVLTATVGKKSKPIKKVEFLKDSTVINTVASPKANGGTETYTYPGPVTANCSLKAQVTDEQDSVVTSNAIAYTFVYPAYVGSVAAGSAAPTETEIKAMTKKIVSKSAITETYTIENKRMCIACPPGWTLTKITDPNGFDVTSSFTKYTVSVTGLDGTAQQYNVYVSAATTQTGFKVTFA